MMPKILIPPKIYYISVYLSATEYAVSALGHWVSQWLYCFILALVLIFLINT